MKKALIHIYVNQELEEFVQMSLEHLRRANPELSLSKASLYRKILQVGIEHLPKDWAFGLRPR